MTRCIYSISLDCTYSSAIPASALDEEEDEEEDEELGETRDDERTGTRYNVCSRSCSINQLLNLKQYSWFHIIFAIAGMYVAMLLTDW